MDEEELRRLFSSSPVARLATVGRDGGPHIVPVVFVLVGNTVFTAIDAKPKRTWRLQRVINIESEPRCSLLVDHYEDDWSKLWWVRADGAAEVVDPAAATDGTEDVALAGLSALTARHAQYDEVPPGPLLVVRISHWTGWSASP